VRFNKAAAAEKTSARSLIVAIGLCQKARSVDRRDRLNLRGGVEAALDTNVVTDLKPVGEGLGRLYEERMRRALADMVNLPMVLTATRKLGALFDSSYLPAGSRSGQIPWSVLP